LTAQYGELWTKTLVKEPNKFFLTQLQNDPFFSPSSGSAADSSDKLIGVTSPLIVDNKVVGIFGTHLAATSLNKIIEPMVVIDQSWLEYVSMFFFVKPKDYVSSVESFSYWVYTGKSLSKYVTTNDPNIRS